MSRKLKKKNGPDKFPVSHSGAPTPPAGRTPGAANSRSRKPSLQPVALKDRWIVPGICIFLAAIIWAVFGQTLGHEFINFDDYSYVCDNPEVAQGLTLKGIAWAFTDLHSGNWHPLTWISHMLDCQLYGLSPGGHHLTNVLLHMLTAILLFLVLRRLTGFLWRSAFVAAVFAIHPLHVESVAWVAERKDVLSGLFFVLTLGAYISYVRHPRSLGRYLVVALMLVLALMSKPMPVTLPFVLLLLDYWPLNRFTQPDGRPAPWRLIVEKIPLLALAGAVSAATLVAQQVAIAPIPFSARIGNALVSCAAYLGQMICPVGLAVYYPHPGSGLAHWKILAALVLLMILSAGAIAARRNQPWILFGWLWYLVMLAPVIGILQVGTQARADRYTYLPQIGLYVLMTWAVADWCVGRPHRRLIAGGFSIVVLTTLIFCARTQTAYWRTSESLWTHALACTSENILVHDNLGNALLQRGSVDQAVFQYQEALRIKPDDSVAYFNLGNAYLQKGSADEAIASYRKALEIKPDYAKAHNNLGNILLQGGNADEAIAHYRKVLEFQPDFLEVQNNLGYALLLKGSVDEAITHFQKALQINPNNVEALNDLAWVLATSPQAAVRNGKRAVELAQRANQIVGGKNPAILRTLAAAYAEAAQFGDAQRCAESAIELARAAGQNDLVDELAGALKLYMAERPFRQNAR